MFGKPLRYAWLNRLVPRESCDYLAPAMAQPPILSWEGLGLQQGGRWLLGGVSLGLVAYGLYCFINAGYRRTRTPRL